MFVFRPDCLLCRAFPAFGFDGKASAFKREEVASVPFEEEALCLGTFVVLYLFSKRMRA